jgi:choline dehydrogenase-like flavoprotein
VSGAPGTLYDWNYTTVSQSALGNRPLHYPEGHVEGGSSSISTFQAIHPALTNLVVDYMAYTRSSSDDFDRIAAVSGDQGWSWKKIFPYFLKVSSVYRSVAHSDLKYNLPE